MTRKNTLALLLGVVAAVFGLFAIAAATIGTTHDSPIAGTWLPAIFIAVGAGLVIAGTATVGMAVARSQRADSASDS